VSELPDHPDPRHRDDARPVRVGGTRSRAATALLTGGRLLLALTVAAVAWSRLTHDAWAGAPLDDAGFTTAWQPNVAMALCVVLGFAWPFVVLPVGSSALVTREADSLIVRTVLGVRRVDVRSARAWRARVPGKGHGTQVVALRSSTGWAVVTASELWLDDGQLLLDDVPPTPSTAWRERWRRSARGWLLVLAALVPLFLILALGGTAAGLF